MPILNVTLSIEPDPVLARKIADGLSRITARVLRKNPAVTAVVLRAVAAELWFVGGDSLAQQNKASFWLDIAVVDGTNTKDEKAQYLSEVFVFMAGVLGKPLHEESYAYVHEVAADAYGYGGVTQEHRYIAAKQAKAA